MFWNKKEPVREINKGPVLSCIHYGHCSKEKCQLWTVFDNTVVVEGKPQQVKEGNCSFAWTPRLLIELRHHLVLAVRGGDKP